MVDVVAEWAGKERLFRLTVGAAFDLEEATGEALGTIFIRVVSGHWKLPYVYETLRITLIAGGMSVVDAKRLMDRHFEDQPFLESATLAGRILTDAMAGVEDRGQKPRGEPEVMKFSEVSQICRVFNMSPDALRKTRYADFVNMVNGFNAASETKAPHLTEEEFLDILERYEPESVT